MRDINELVHPLEYHLMIGSNIDFFFPAMMVNPLSYNKILTHHLIISKIKYDKKDLNYIDSYHSLFCIAKKFGISDNGICLPGYIKDVLKKQLK